MLKVSEIATWGELSDCSALTVSDVMLPTLQMEKLTNPTAQKSGAQNQNKLMRFIYTDLVLRECPSVPLQCIFEGLLAEDPGLHSLVPCPLCRPFALVGSRCKMRPNDSVLHPICNGVSDLHERQGNRELGRTDSRSLLHYSIGLALQATVKPLLSHSTRR